MTETPDGQRLALRRPAFWLAAIFSAATISGCGHGAKPAAAAGVVHKHEHHPPHGGTPVVLGNEEHHLELVLDPPSGTLRAYVLDGEMENFTRVTAESFDIVARVGGREERLTLHAVANNATGEKVGDTSEFDGQAPWLKTNATFDATLADLTVQGGHYQQVPFNFPKGNDTDATP